MLLNKKDMDCLYLGKDMNCFPRDHRNEFTFDIISG